MVEATQIAEPARAGQRTAIAVAIGSVALALFIILVLRARFDVATFALVLVGLALALCLRSLHRMVGVLARDTLDTVIETEGEFGGASTRELREERRRLLRAINELRFDHEMGKLSQADYDAVREGYELRAVEVMRALDAGESLHPELAARLAKVDETPVPTPVVSELAAEAEPVESPAAAPTATTRACASCDGANDPDARFCKHCGKELAA